MGEGLVGAMCNTCVTVYLENFEELLYVDLFYLFTYLFIYLFIL